MPEPLSPKIGFRHEGRRLAIGIGDLVDGVFVDLQMVGHRGQRAELHAEFVLRGGHFVVVLLDVDAHGRHGREHFAAHVLGGIDRGNREIAALVRTRWPRLPPS